MEYSTMAFGMRNLVLLAAGLYLLSLLALLSAKRRSSWPETVPGTGEGAAVEEITGEPDGGAAAMDPDAGIPEEGVPATLA